MKVKELIDALGKYDPDLEVLCYSEDEQLVLPKHLFRLLEIEGVDVVNGEKQRDDKGIPTLKIGKSDAAARHVVLNVIADF